MAKSIQTNRRNLSQIIPLVFIGIGLIAIGIVTAGMLSTGQSDKVTSVVPVAVKFPAPELTLNNLQGEKVSISDYQDKILLINNWATWCPPCRAEMPILSKYYQDHSEHGFILIAIEAGEPVDEVAKFVEEFNLSFPILVDPDNQALAAFKNDSLPSSYVIDHEGNVVYAWTGPISQAMLEKYITPLLEQ
jgi:peroxiredoxin